MKARGLEAAAPCSPVGRFQEHHLIPLALGHRPQIGRFLLGLWSAGFDLRDRAGNCLRLPADEATALRLGASLHRGPHPRYSDVIAARVDRIRGVAARASDPHADAVRRLARLQRSLAAVLAGEAPRLFRLNRRDPMRLFADYSSLEAAIALVSLPVDQG